MHDVFAQQQDMHHTLRSRQAVISTHVYLLSVARTWARTSVQRECGKVHWFKKAWRRAKQARRCAEEIYSSYGQNPALTDLSTKAQNDCHVMSKAQRAVVQTAHKEYWSATFTGSTDCKTLWKKMRLFLDRSSFSSGLP